MTDNKDWKFVGFRRLVSVVVALRPRGLALASAGTTAKLGSLCHWRSSSLGDARGAGHDSWGRRSAVDLRDFLDGRDAAQLGRKLSGKEEQRR